MRFAVSAALPHRRRPAAEPRATITTVVIWLLALAAGIISFDRAARLRYDFAHFYLDARYVWEHGALNPDLDNADLNLRRQLPFYLPVVPVLLAPLTAGGLLPAAMAWALLQAAAVAYSLRALRRWSRAAGDSALLLAALFALPTIWEAARFNQLSFFVLALVLAGIERVRGGGAESLSSISSAERSRSHPRGAVVMGGALLGAAAVMKLLPGIFVLWLVLTRRWRGLAGFVAAALLLAIVPCLLVFGPHRTLAYHREWWEFNARGAAAEGMTDPELREHFIDARNQSIPAVVSRLCWPEHPYRLPWRPAALSPLTCRTIAYGVAAALLAGLALATWQAQTEASSIAAAYALAMIVFAPLLRQYYLVWTLPALVVLADQALRGATRRSAALGWLGLSIWLLGMAAWLSETARAAGAHLLMLIIIGIAIIAGTPRRAAQR